MTILDCCISLKIIKKKCVVLGVVDMHQLLLIIRILIVQKVSYYVLSLSQVGRSIL